MSSAHASLVEEALARIEQDVQFLVDQNCLSAQDASGIVQRLSTSTRVPATLKATHQTPAVSPASPNPPYAVYQSDKVRRCRALWGYNERAREKNDLAFSAGDVIEIVEETNEDWWTGRFKGKDGLFPSNHVEMLQETVSQPRRNMPPPPPAKSFQMPFKGAFQGRKQTTNSIGLKEDPSLGAKKARNDALKNTMMHSAAAGLGGGAGAALGAGLVRKII